MKNGLFKNVSGDSSVLNQMELQTRQLGWHLATQLHRFSQDILCDIPTHSPLTIPSFTDAFTHLWSVDLDRDVVTLRRPLGDFRHFEARANQINTELALDRAQ